MPGLAVVTGDLDLQLLDPGTVAPGCASISTGSTVTGLRSATLWLSTVGWYRTPSIGSSFSSVVATDENVQHRSILVLNV